MTEHPRDPIIVVGDPVNSSWIFKHPDKNDADVYSLIEKTSTFPPFDHQRRAVNTSIKELLVARYIALLMDMGTGKTKTTIDIFSILSAMQKCDGILVICPKPLTAVWEDEFPKHSSIPFPMYVWDGKKTKKSDAEFGSFIEQDGPKVFIINIEAFRVPNEKMKERLFAFVKGKEILGIVDESSYIKESTSNQTKNITKLGLRLAFKMILTGTEIINSPLDLFAQFEFLCQGFWNIKSFFMFKLRYAILQDCYGAGGRVFKKVSGYQKLDEILSIITPHVFRARLEECLDLPESIHQVIRVELSQAQRAAYESLRKHLVAILESGEILSVENKVSLFTKFRQIPGGIVCVKDEKAIIEEDPPKLQALLASIESSGEQAIIWASFTAEIEMLVERLSKIGKTVAFYGGIDQRLRDANVRDFQQGHARFFVANPQSGGFGLNLQNCHIQFTYSRHLSPASSWQAEARTRRAGQKQTCVYISLVAKNTVDERIEFLLEEKRKIRDAFRSMKPEEVMKFQAEDEKEMINAASLSVEEMIQALGPSDF